MPTLTATSVLATQVTVSDLLCWNGVETQIADVDRKPVWVYISLIGSDKQVRVKGTDLVTVMRMVSSDEEIAVAKRAAFNSMIVKAIDSSATDYAKACEELAACPTDWRNISATVAAGRTFELYRHVTRCAEIQEIDYIAAYEAVAAEEKERLLETTISSQSTSMMSNAVDAVRHDATVKFLRFAALGW